MLTAWNWSTVTGVTGDSELRSPKRCQLHGYLSAFYLHSNSGIFKPATYTGWWFQPTPLKNIASSVGIIIPNIWKKMFQTTNQYMITSTVENFLRRTRSSPEKGRASPCWTLWTKWENSTHPLFRQTLFRMDRMEHEKWNIQRPNMNVINMKNGRWMFYQLG